jgi:hypothetical protein
MRVCVRARAGSLTFPVAAQTHHLLLLNYQTSYTDTKLAGFKNNFKPTLILSPNGISDNIS